MLFDLVETVVTIASTMASLLGWPSADAQRYTRLVYVDKDIRLLLETESSKVGQIVAEGVVEILKERMKRLRELEYRAIYLEQQAGGMPISDIDRRFIADVQEEIQRREDRFKRLTR